MNPRFADQLPPHSIEAEQGILGCILLDPPTVVPICRFSVHEKEWFYDLRNREVWLAICAMDDAGTAVDLLTLVQRLKDDSQLEGVGGMAYLSSLMDAVPSAANIDHYVNIVREKYAQRTSLQTAVELQQRIRAGGSDLSAEQTLLEATEYLMHVADRVSAARPIQSMKELVRDVIGTVEHSFRHRNQGLVHGSLASGFGYYDKKTSGIHQSELTILAGRPGTGKTSLICSMLLNMCIEAKTPCVFFSLEMTKKAIVERLLCAGARVNMKQIHSGMCTESDLRSMLAFAPKLAAAPLFIDDASGLTPRELIARARRYVPTYSAKCVFVDHLHEIHVPEAGGDEKIQSTASAVALKLIAKKMSIPVVAAAQLSRTFETESAKSRNRLPRSTDIRGSGYIEQIADVIGILHRDESDDGEEEEGGKKERPNWGALDEWPVSLEITKQRNGPTGPVKFNFIRTSMLYQDRFHNRGAVSGATKEDWS